MRSSSGRRAMRLRAGFLAWLLQALQVEGKVQSGKVGIGGPGEQNRWQYLSKFGFDLGWGEYQVRVRLHRPGSIRHSAQLLTLHLHLDEAWDQVQSQVACGRVVEGLARLSYDVEIRKSGEWSDWQDGHLEHRVRPHIWYFALSNCGNEMNSNETVEVEFEFRARQEGGSEFGVEAQYMLSVHVVAMLLLSIFLVDYAARCVAFRKSNLAIHPVIWVLTGALALQYTAQALHSVHLWLYRSDGLGSPLLDTMSESLLMASQVVHTTLLIVIAQGYTLLVSHDEDEDAKAMKLIAAAVLLVHSALVWFGRVEDDAWHKNHHNEGTIGWIILAIRLVLFGWFVHAARRTQLVAGLRQAAFLRRFSMAGGVYFLAYPAIFLIVQVLAPYLRHPVMQVGVLTMQLTSDFWLAGLFLCRGAYFEVSSLSCAILPDPRSPARGLSRASTGDQSAAASPTFGCGGGGAPAASPASGAVSRRHMEQSGAGAASASVRRRLNWADEVGFEVASPAGGGSPDSCRRSPASDPLHVARATTVPAGIS